MCQIALTAKGNPSLISIRHVNVDAFQRQVMKLFGDLNIEPRAIGYCTPRGGGEVLAEVCGLDMSQWSKLQTDATDPNRPMLAGDGVNLS
jgi:hypothetical protein